MPRVAFVKKGGRKASLIAQPSLVQTLHNIVEVHTAGSPVEPGKLWTNRSPQELAVQLGSFGFDVSRNTVAKLLIEELELGRRQAVKSRALGDHPDRNAQFELLAQFKQEYIDRGWPVLSVDTKKKELLGNFHRPGQAWTNGRVQVFDHDFPGAGDGKVIPYGVYDLATNEALVYVARGADTAELAVDALRHWWLRRGRRRYEGAGGMLLLADSGGSNGYRLPLFRERLCLLATRINCPIRVAHLPPYCSKYNPIDHRLFCHLSRSLNGVICRTIENLVDAIRRTTTSAGLRVFVELARKVYERGVRATQAYLEDEWICRDEHLSQFNYTAVVM